MRTNKQDFPAKNSKKRPFKFQVNVSRLPKKSRQIRLAEDSLLQILKNFGSLKMPDRGIGMYDDSYDELIYLPIYNLCNLFYDQMTPEDFVNKYWSSDSEVLGYIHDVSSVSGTPDYTLKKESSVDQTSVDILLGMFTEYMKRNGTVRISKKNIQKHVSGWLFI